MIEHKGVEIERVTLNQLETLRRRIFDREKRPEAVADLQTGCFQHTSIGR